MKLNFLPDRAPDQNAAPSGQSVTPTVAIADRHELIRAALKALLVQVGFPVAWETSEGELVVDCVLRDKPNVLILGTGLNGLPTTDVLRRLKEQRHTRILAICESSDEWRMIRELKEGASGIVTLGCSASELRNAIIKIAAGEPYLEPCVGTRALNLALNSHGRSDPTPREGMVLQLAAQGLTSAEIAARLHISRRTAEAHRASFMRKLGLRTQTDLVLYAVRAGIVSA